MMQEKEGRKPGAVALALGDQWHLAVKNLAVASYRLAGRGRSGGMD